MSSEKPVVFLAFANEYEANRRLDNVVKEREQLEEILNQAYRNGLCDKPIVRQNVSIKTFLDVLGSDEYKNRIAIIHYGGHADGYQLLLEGLDGKRQVAKGDSLVNILARRENQENLKLVFLNGCSTERLAKALTDRGVPIVIGTSTSIKDDEALTVSTRFYTALANGLTMAGAWADAKNEVESVTDAEDAVKDSGKTRGIALPEEEAGSFPWEESFRDSAAEVDFKNWNLPEESQNPLFNLPPLEKTQLPASPFLFLKPYEARHAEIFFGRSSYIRDLWLKVDERNAPPIIMLYGESGAGKSSLLDAGLRPRLEAAKREDGSKRFEVRYRRRDQDQGLVRTLAEMLSYQPEEEPDEPAPAEEPAEDPNLEKIQQIEAIAEELEEETANTFRAVINRYKDIRAYRPGKQSGQGLYTEDADGYLALHEEAGARLRRAWIKLEKETGRDVILILDQVEEAVTQPNSKIRKELEGLLRVLKDIFVRPPADEKDAIKGKIILGYREEFNAKILARSQDFELSPSTVFLEQLRQEDIEEIFRELPKLRGTNYYNLTVEKGLPEKVANDLLKGRSAVAPVLQLLLTKLWEHTYDQDKNSAHFSAKAYNETQSGGREMEKYFREQMEAVREWNPEVVDSGLVLDILQFHVTELGTSRRRHFEKDIQPRYQHLEAEYEYPPGFVEKLVNKLKSTDIFLLNDEGRGYTSLPHDTLAPIVRREYDRSDKLGQRSARILEVKKPDLERTREEEDELRKLRLNDNDLEVVEGGKKGMRSLNETERKLLQISMEERNKRLRQRRAMIKGGTVLMLFILVLSIFAGSLSVSMVEQIKNGVITHANEVSVLEKDKNPVKAIQLAQFAYDEGEAHPLEVVRNLYGLYHEHGALDPYGSYGEGDLFYDEEAYLYEEEAGESLDEYDSGEGFEGESIGSAPAPAPPLEKANGSEPGAFHATAGAGEPEQAFSLTNAAKISSLNYYPSLGILASLSDKTLKYWPQGALRREPTGELKGEITIDLKEGFDDISDLEFGLSADGKNIQVLYRLGRDPLYLLDGELNTAPYLYLVFRDTSYYGGSAEEADQIIGYYDFYLGKFVDLYGLNYAEDEFYQYLEDYYYGYGDPTQYLYIKEEGSGAFVPLNIAKLFSFNLMDRERAMFREKEFKKLSRLGWEILDAPSLEENPDNEERRIPLRATNLTKGTYNESLIWHPDGFTEGPASIYQDTNELHFLTALTDTSFLIVSQYEGVSIKSVFNNPPVLLLPADSAVIDLAISPGPDKQYIFAMTSLGSVLLWDLNGRPVKNYPHPDIQGYSFSADGAKLLTLSENQAKVFSLDTKAGPTTYPRPSDSPPITFARFHSDNKKVVLGQSHPKALSLWEKIKSWFSKKWNSRIVLWDPEDQEKEAFTGPRGPLLDAAISADERFAIALQAEKAVVIPNPNQGIRKREYNSKPIECNTSNKGENQKIFLSPGGKYLVRQSRSRTDSRAELFGHKGELVNAYKFQNGFRQGFNGQLFTPHDYYLIGARPKEVLLWRPEDETVETWAGDFELYPGEKQKYGLDTFMDYIPGTKTDPRWWADAKWWAIAVILASLIFILLYFSDYIIRFIQEKNYIELALYSSGFVLFSLLLLSLWKIGAAELDPQINKIAFYCLVFATLAIAAAGARRALASQKYPALLSISLVGLFTLFGFFKFTQCEKEQHLEEQQRSFKREVQWHYQENKEKYHKFYLESRNPEDTAVNKMPLHEAIKLVEEFPDEFDVYKPPRDREWWNILSGLLLLLGFLGIVAYPIYRPLGRYRKEKQMDWKFFRPLLLPIAFLGITAWIAVSMQDDSGNAFGNVLNVLSGVLLLGIVIRQSRAYFQEKKYASLVAFGLSTLFIGGILLIESGLFALALAAAFILGRQYHRQGAFGKSFLLAGANIILAVGALIWSIEYDILSVLLGFLLAAALVLIFYGMRRQLQHISSRRASGRWAIANWAAIAGLWFLGYFLSLAFLGAMIEAFGFEEAYSEAVYFREENDSGTPANLLDEESLMEEEPTDELLTEETMPDEGAAYPQEDSLEASAITEPAAPGEVDFDATALNNRQQLIVKLFDPDAVTRERARADLETYWTGDRALIPELIQYSRENPDKVEGVFEALGLLAMQPDELLQSNRSLLGPYLESVAQMELGADEQIQELADRIGY